MKYDKFIRIAKKISQKSDHHSHKMTCLIVKGSRIIGVGYNKLRKKSAKSPHPYFSIHAEYAAVIYAKHAVSGATAFIFRQTKDGTFATAKPCASCYQFLVNQGISEIVYTFEGSYKEEKLK